MTVLKQLTDDQLHIRTVKVARREQKFTLLTMEHIREVFDRKLHLKRGYSKIQEYCVKALGFSDTAASQRVQVMMLTDEVPEANEMLKSGDLQLSTAAAVRRFIRKEEAVSRRALSPGEKRQLLTEVAGQSTRATERILLSHSAHPELHVCRESEKAVTSTRTELKFYADPGIMAELERVRELRGPGTLEEIFRAALTSYLNRIDPMRKKQRSASPTSVADAESRPPSRHVSAKDVREVASHSGGRCEFVDERTGRRCESRCSLEIDHIVPYSHGGPTTCENLRHLCKPHHGLVTIETFGVSRTSPGSAPNLDSTRADAGKSRPG